MSHSVNVDQHHEGVPLTGGILFPLQVGMDQLRGVWNELVEIPVGKYTVSFYTSNTPPLFPISSLEDGVNGQHGVPSYVGVSVFQTGTDRGHERLEEFRFLQFAEEPQS